MNRPPTRNNCGFQTKHIVFDSEHQRQDYYKKIDSGKISVPISIPTNNVMQKVEVLPNKKEKVYKPCERLLIRLKKQHAKNGLYL